MKISDACNHKKSLSFEIFPPKKDSELKNIDATLDVLCELQPDFISVTYGAGGSRSKRTVELASFIQNSLHIPAVAHMTCVGSSKEDILTVTDDMKQAGLSHVLALRGDRPTWMDDAQFENRAFAHASDLTRFLKEHTDLEVAGACYPEKHFEAANPQSDLQYLKEKVDAGADYIVTQMFFDNSKYFDFVERCRKAGITVPIIPGIKPISTPKHLEILPRTFSVSLPEELVKAVRACGEDTQAAREVGIEWAIHQAKELKAAGVPIIHFYTMGRTDNIRKIARNVF